MSIKTDTSRFRPSFFDVFVADDFMKEGTIPTELVSLSLVGGLKTPVSYELLLRVPADGIKPGDGSVVVQMDGAPVAMARMTLLRPSSPVQYVLCSSQAIDSFFDIFTEISLDGGGRRIGSFFDIFTEISFDGSSQRVSSFFDIFTEISFDGRGPGAAEKLRAIRRRLLEALRQSISLEKRALDALYAEDPRLERALRLLRCLASEEEGALQMMLTPRR